MIIKPEDLVLEHPNILVDEFEPETKGYNAGQSLEDKPFFGRVINTNNGSKYTIDQILMFGQNSTSRVSINGKMYFIIREDDVIAVIKK